eukprot:TRINITY_DN18399_c0_g2_i1.p1 TRINITY_DN18399_c0_g2~~TRINITY_DN18399_c0_g2_i1.p1  ORF type:complete len:670 (+),score=90.87 TRINITY_DN18399_c0_g2_i1:46-2010(+)
MATITLQLRHLLIAVVFLLGAALAVAEIPHAGSKYCQEKLSKQQASKPEGGSSEELNKFGEAAELMVLPVSGALLLTLVLVPLLEGLKLHWMPESALVILIGAGLGGVLVAYFGSDDVVNSHILHEVNPFVLNLLLPIIIFESGWTLRWRDFASQFLYIFIFAVIGSLISTCVVGSLIHATGDQHRVLSTRTAYAFAALISATDPVATLATYSQLNVEPLLNIMVFGESTINDAVAIVLFDILNDNDIFGDGCTPSQTSSADIWKAIASGVIQKLLGSLFLGLGLACAYTLILRFAKLHHSQLMEILYIVTTAYLTFSIAEQVYVSGIIAVLFCSMAMGVYTKPHLSQEGLLLSTFFVKGLATLADTCVFLLVGVDAIAISGSSWKFSIWVMLFLLIGRAAAVSLCGLICNLIKTAHGKAQGEPQCRWFLLTWRHFFMMWHAGLRGGIALVLCLQIGDWADALDGAETRQTLINATVAVICAFLLIFGGSTYFFLNLLGIPMGQELPFDYLYTSTLFSCTKTGFSFLQRRVLWPMLVGSKFPAGDVEAAAGAGVDETTYVEAEKQQKVSLYGVLQASLFAHRSHTFYKRAASKALQDEISDSGTPGKGPLGAIEEEESQRRRRSNEDGENQNQGEGESISTDSALAHQDGLWSI